MYSRSILDLAFTQCLSA